ncbi:7-carboxy-7-deazaguanine synthase QueE [Mangrovibacterium diazotrophicum]|uniref:7-carboxy-7-deazaguanine synthase n=1 Tax=Mangrovibacterium diazotrophicum TaxID=1261403 RepID=A0A419W460_9BACT|nr:7-carboxy-7-deazaguanine synthase QueE [Mangrovibacterium diazotrophicum]RKD90244.1 organic radical activating enzyme [Mangrovibacterium diazotrophicum]
MSVNLTVNEIFYSLQGEGSRAGIPNIFIRLSKCNLNCWFCDTEFESGESYSLEQLLDEISQFPCKNIIWTGGEPALQLTEEIVGFFKERGYYQAIETNGTKPLPSNLDFVTCSPKQVTAEQLKRNFPNGVSEMKCIFNENPEYAIEELPEAQHYFLSPVFLGKEKERMDMDKNILQRCIDYILANPGWQLSIQQHKVWNIR